MILKQKCCATLSPYGSLLAFITKRHFDEVPGNTRDNSKSSNTKMLNCNIWLLFHPQYNKLMNWEESLI